MKSSNILTAREAYLQQEVLLGHGHTVIPFAKVSWLKIKLPNFIKRGAPFPLVLTPENVLKLTGRERKLVFKAISVEAEPSEDGVSCGFRRRTFWYGYDINDIKSAKNGLRFLNIYRGTKHFSCYTRAKKYSSFEI